MQNTTFAPNHVAPAHVSYQQPQAPAGYEPSVTDEATNYVDLSAPRSIETDQIHVPRLRDKILSHFGKLQKFQDMTIGDAQRRVATTTQRISAEVAATTRGIVAGATGATLGLLEGLPVGAGTALLGPDRLFLLRLKTQETTPELIGMVESTSKRDGVGFISFRLFKNLNGTPCPDNTVSKPMPTTTAFRQQVNFNGDVFKAVLLPIQAQVGDRTKVVGFIAIDDRDPSERRVYRIMKPAQ